MTDVKTPDTAAVDNAVTTVLTEHYGFLPLHVRYAAAEAARNVIEEWADKGYEFQPSDDRVTHTSEAGVEHVWDWTRGQWSPEMAEDGA